MKREWRPGSRLSKVFLGMASAKVLGWKCGSGSGGTPVGEAREAIGQILGDRVGHEEAFSLTLSELRRHWRD